MHPSPLRFCTRGGVGGVSSFFLPPGPCSGPRSPHGERGDRSRPFPRPRLDCPLVSPFPACTSEFQTPTPTAKRTICSVRLPGGACPGQTGDGTPWRSRPLSPRAPPHAPFTQRPAPDPQARGSPRERGLPPALWSELQVLGVGTRPRAGTWRALPHCTGEQPHGRRLWKTPKPDPKAQREAGSRAGGCGSSQWTVRGSSW